MHLRQRACSILLLTVSAYTFSLPARQSLLRCRGRLRSPQPLSRRRANASSLARPLFAAEVDEDDDGELGKWGFGGEAATARSNKDSGKAANATNGACSEVDAVLRRRAIKQMAAYMWPRGDYRTKGLLLSSLTFLVVGKLLNAQVPFVLQRAVDRFSSGGCVAAVGGAASLSLFFVYGLSRVVTVLLNELKTVTFAHISQSALRRFSNTIFGHLHVLDNRFHHDNPSGLLSVAYVRGVRGFQAILFQLVFAVVPTMAELIITATVLTRRCGSKYALATLATFVTYCSYTSLITEWRMKIRRALVDVDNSRNAYFVDSMANSETVKLFSNEAHEAAKFDRFLGAIHFYNLRNTYAIALLNVGQAAIFSLGLTLVMFFTAAEVAAGRMTVGNIVAVNGLLLQLQQPFNFIGYTYQEIRQGFVDMHLMLDLLRKRPEIEDLSGRRHQLLQQIRVVDDAEAALATRRQEKYNRQGCGLRRQVAPSNISKSRFRLWSGRARRRWRERREERRLWHRRRSLGSPAFLEEEDLGRREEGHGVVAGGDDRGCFGVVLPPARGELEFRNVTFSYNPGSDPAPQLNSVSFVARPGETVALVGSSGSGKSTTLKLLTRLHDACSGSVLVDGADVTELPLVELRRRVAIISQDTVLFDDTVAYNIRYGNLAAGNKAVVAAAKQAQVHGQVLKQRDAYATRVGERGSKLSGGERQRVAIARTVLREPSIMLCDEVTSAVDPETEMEIVDALKHANKGRTCVMVAHRLRSIVHADRILVMRHGRIVESGTHESLLANPRGGTGDDLNPDAGGFYKKMWRLQHSAVSRGGGEEAASTMVTHGDGDATVTTTGR
jgi:ABC-type transport system involved in Fe-S cluster assembly fused permease/ATPase subunit